MLGRKHQPIHSHLLALALLSLFLISAISLPAHAASTTSSKVAYVTDFGTGICDTFGPGSGSSVLDNAVTGGVPAGCIGGGALTYTTGSNPFATVANGITVTFTDISVAAVNAGGVGVLAPFDTVISYEVCDIGSPANANYMAALNAYVAAQDGKLIILDGDRCAPISAGTAVYDGSAGGTAFIFPFTSSNPGPSGFVSATTFQESEPAPNTVSRNLPVGSGSGTDAIGDSNTFTTFNGAWCAAIEGTNGLGVTGIQMGYAHSQPVNPNGGLVIWNGFDNWFTFGANFVDAQAFDNMLDQPFNPDTLPCGLVASGISLSPTSATNPVGGSHTVTAFVFNTITGVGLPGVTVTFTVTAGPNAGQTGTAVTDATGHASFTYSDTGGAGTDTIVAKFTDTNGAVHTSNTATKIWGAVGVPEFGTPATLVAAMGLLAASLLSRRMRPTRTATLP